MLASVDGQSPTYLGGRAQRRGADGLLAEVDAGCCADPVECTVDGGAEADAGDHPALMVDEQ
ncbi:Uncharacterised protein [Mycobacteroides abscessus subsp. abscessus]|nr:Uncharacterised protein [Mycobacteroides abscessus subsp. abscessus]